MTQTIIKVPAVGGGAFDPTDIEITDNTSGAFLVKEGSNEYIRIDTTNGSEQIVLKGRPSSANAKLVMSDQPFLQGADNQNIQMTSSGIALSLPGASGKRITNKLAHSTAFFSVLDSGNANLFKVDEDSSSTFTLDDASGAVFKIVDDDSSPRTYFTATEDGVVEVDGVKVGLGGGRIHDNVAVGKDAFAGTQTGFGNSLAVGFEAGKAQVGGYNNTFLGFKTGLVTVNSINNTAVGFACMDGINGANVLTGADNTGVGSSACRSLTSGTENVGIGRDALNSCTTGANNVAVGMAAGDAIVGGSGNIAIGHDSDCDAAGTNQIAIGNGVVVAGTNRFAAIGDSSNVATLDFGAGGSWSSASDVRIKENIQDGDLGLEFINSLRPVKHTSKDPTQWPEEIRPAESSDRTSEELAVVNDGLIAQEVKAAADALGTSFSGWEQDANGLNRLQYERFVVPLIKAVQELSAEVEELKGDK